MVLFDQSLDNESIRSALDLHRREISREQMLQFEGYMAEILLACGADL